MAPKRRKVVGSVVRMKTTRKVVREGEAVEVSFVETNINSEPQLTQEEENRETEEREEERVEIDLLGKTPTRVIAVQDPKAKPKAEEQPPENEPEYSTPPEDVVEDQFPLDEDHEDGKKETDKADDGGKEGKPPPEDQVQPEQDEDEDTQDLAEEAESTMNETATPSEEASDDQEKQQEQGQEQAKESEEGIGKRENEGKKRGRKKRVKRMEMGERAGYKRYIHKVLKQVHPELGISSNAITVLDGFMKDMFERLANEANNLTKHTKKKTLSSREVQAAVRLVLPGELGKHAVVEGNKAVANYMSYDEGVAVAGTKKKKL